VIGLGAKIEKKEKVKKEKDNKQNKTKKRPLATNRHLGDWLKGRKKAPPAITIWVIDRRSEKCNKENSMPITMWAISIEA
jgi:hypothetical protein